MIVKFLCRLSGTPPTAVVCLCVTSALASAIAQPGGSVQAFVAKPNGKQ